MAGHSKWANIKFRKAAQDAKRGKVFTKHIKEITVAARIGGEDPDANPRLRAAIDKALSANMTRDTIARAVARGAGAASGEAFEEILYEGYGTDGVAVLVECATDNRNRTVGEVRHAFSKHGGKLANEGSVAYLFKQLGCLVFEAPFDEEQIMEIALAADAEDIDQADGMIEVTAAPQNYHRVEQQFRAAGLTPHISELLRRPDTHVELQGEPAEAIRKLIDALEQLDDVQNVFTNAAFLDTP